MTKFATELGLMDNEKSGQHDENNENENFFVKQMKQLTKYFGN